MALLGLGFGLVLKFDSGGTPVGWCMLLALVGIPILSNVVTIDDDLPGGWSNPDGKQIPPWLHWHFLVQLLLMGSVSGVGFAIDAYPDIWPAFLWLTLGSAGVIGTYLFVRYIERRTA